ncbi:protein phosphatase 2C domain-containing protein [Virgibacillus sp. YIM 98842]|uniref:protein phosphatase 2C domain-containing protein n=1 Tax=Virgibacillus sp. YIM 98842 TaxID=2663533 RepID=UPI0013DD7192|nr:protein phosphatase 2C domain-containing protein [Virgibacillus sp. YIM 98842]
MKRINVAVFQKPKKGKYYCGDSYFYLETENEFLCAIADGLGSGEYARESSQIVIDIIRKNMNESIESIIKICNEQLFGKRGVVLGILKINFDSMLYSFSSIGNIGIVTANRNKKKKRNIPSSGYLAGYPRKFKVIQERLEKNMNFIMFSDGVNDKDLSDLDIFGNNVENIIKTFQYKSKPERDDDTTLIAMRYQ